MEVVLMEHAGINLLIAEFLADHAAPAVVNKI
jgi:hypothetical protein